MLQLNQGVKRAKYSAGLGKKGGGEGPAVMKDEAYIDGGGRGIERKWPFSRKRRNVKKQIDSGTERA